MVVLLSQEHIFKIFSKLSSKIHLQNIFRDDFEVKILCVLSSPEEPPEPVPPSPGRWSQDLLGSLDRWGNKFSFPPPESQMKKNYICNH